MELFTRRLPKPSGSGLSQPPATWSGSCRAANWRMMRLTRSCDFCLISLRLNCCLSGSFWLSRIMDFSILSAIAAVARLRAFCCKSAASGLRPPCVSQASKAAFRSLAVILLRASSWRPTRRAYSSRYLRRSSSFVSFLYAFPFVGSKAGIVFAPESRFPSQMADYLADA